MKAEIVSIGTELLLGQTVDTNATEISTWLAEMGIGVYFHQTVGDNADRLKSVMELALHRSDIVVVTGGLGPTEDDVTREILAEATGRKLISNNEAFEQLSRYLKSVDREMTDHHRRQTYTPEGASVLPNGVGTAPGIYLHTENTHVFCMPGVPPEMRRMWKEAVVPHLLRITGGQEGIIASRTLRFYGIGETELESRLEGLLHHENPTLAPYAGNGEVRLRITARASSEDDAFSLIEPIEGEVTGRVGRFVYGFDDDTLESVVGQYLGDSGRTVATAESCTGGLIADRLTDIPGSSRYFKGGWVVYSNDAKSKQLGVDPELIRQHGAVSAEVAEMMAVGALERSGSDIALAVTGIVGPGGGTDDKPVGLVYFALARDHSVQVEKRQFRANGREQNKWRSASEGLNLIRLAIKNGSA